MMTDRPSPHASDDPHDLEDLDPQQFVGEAPVGDSSPGEFMSNDQSPHDGPEDPGERGDPGDRGTPDDPDAPDDPAPEEDA